MISQETNRFVITDDGHRAGHTDYRDHNGALLSYRTANFGTPKIDRYLVSDHQDSIVGVFDAAGAWLGGYSYSPYGESRHSISTTTVPRLGMGYIGGQTSYTNMLKLGARYYDFKYTGSNNWVGAPVKISDVAGQMMTLTPLSKAYDLYATFEVKF